MVWNPSGGWCLNILGLPWQQLAAEMSLQIWTGPVILRLWPSVGGLGLLLDLLFHQHLMVLAWCQDLLI